MNDSNRQIMLIDSYHTIQLILLLVSLDGILREPSQSHLP